MAKQDDQALTGAAEGVAALARLSADQAQKAMAGKSEDDILAMLDSTDALPGPLHTPHGTAAERAPKGAPGGDGPAGTSEAEEGAAAAGVDESPAHSSSHSDTEAAAPSDSSDAAYETALRALRRAKTPDSVVSGLDREAVLSWGSELARVQARNDQTYTDLEALKKQREQATSADPKPAGEATNASAPADATGVADLGPVTSKLAEVLGLDDEGGEVLGEALKALVHPLREQLASRDQRDQARDAALSRLLLDGARGRLQERFPQLGDQATFGKVLDKARSLFRTGDYDSVDAAMEDAASLTLQAELVQNEVAKDKQRTSAKDRGRLTPPRKPTQGASLSLDDRLDVVLQQLDAGASDAEAAAAAGW